MAVLQTLEVSATVLLFSLYNFEILSHYRIVESVKENILMSHYSLLLEISHDEML
jgi:hypothetical protein